MKDKQKDFKEEQKQREILLKQKIKSMKIHQGYDSSKNMTDLQRKILFKHQRRERIYSENSQLKVKIRCFSFKINILENC